MNFINALEAAATADQVNGRSRRDAMLNAVQEGIKQNASLGKYHYNHVGGLPLKFRKKLEAAGFKVIVGYDFTRSSQYTNISW